MGVWQWFNYYEAHVPAGKELVILNLDETCVAFFHGDRKGNVIARSKKFWPGKTPVQRASRHEQRACVTHVAIIANNQEVQQYLPQEILGNQHVLLVRDVRELQATIPPNIQIIRGKSGWTNIEYMRQLMKRIGNAVKRAGEQYWPILLMDCARQHLHHSVFTAAKRNNIRIVLIPAKLTWLLQPCDTHLFLSYKQTLRRLYQDAKAKVNSGKITILQWLRMLVTVITSVLESKSWEKSFLEDGFGNQQMSTSTFILKHMEMTAMLPASNEQPTSDVLHTVLPGHTHMAPTTLLNLSKISVALVDAEDSVPAIETAEDSQDDHVSDSIIGAHSDTLDTLLDDDMPHPHAASSRDPPALVDPTEPRTWSPLQRSPPRRMLRASAKALARAPLGASPPPPESLAGPIWRRTRSRTSAFDPNS